MDRTSMGSDSFSEVFQKIRAKPALIPLFATTAWSIWYQRNKTRLHENPLPLRNIANFAKNYINDFKGMDRPSVQRKWAVPRKWSPLVVDSVKINYDGAMFGESDIAGIGVVIRNCKGQVMAALSKQIVKPPTVDFLELLAAR